MFIKEKAVGDTLSVFLFFRFERQKHNTLIHGKTFTLKTKGLMQIDWKHYIICKFLGIKRFCPIF